LSLSVLLAGVAVADKVLELRFDEGQGEEVADSSGMGNNGTVVGANWVAGKFGSALEFDGAGTHAEVPDSASLQITEEMTVAAWVLFHKLGASDNHDAIIAKASTWSFITFKRSDPAYQFGWWDSVAKNIMPGEPKWLVSGWVPEVETWYHMAVTVKSQEGLIFYRDSEVIKESEYPADLPAGADKTILIGTGNSVGESMSGIVDEVTIFNTALSADEIGDLLLNPTAVSPAAKLGTVWGKLKAQ
jgi:hypothetical protein